jgi:hypothetical protein
MGKASIHSKENSAVQGSDSSNQWPGIWKENNKFSSPVLYAVLALAIQTSRYISTAAGSSLPPLELKRLAISFAFMFDHNQGFRKRSIEANRHVILVTLPTGNFI